MLSLSYTELWAIVNQLIFWGVRRGSGSMGRAKFSRFDCHWWRLLGIDNFCTQSHFLIFIAPFAYFTFIFFFCLSTWSSSRQKILPQIRLLLLKDSNCSYKCRNRTPSLRSGQLLPKITQLEAPSRIWLKRNQGMTSTSSLMVCPESVACMCPWYYTCYYFYISYSSGYLTWRYYRRILPLFVVINLDLI